MEEKMAVQRESQIARAEHANHKLVAAAVVSEPSESQWSGIFWAVGVRVVGGVANRVIWLKTRQGSGQAR
jgi:hypothetical protein